MVMDLKKEFGQMIKSMRLRRGFSQEVLAERADLHRTYVTDIERGTRNLTLESISKLAGALGVQIRDFFPPAFGSPTDLGADAPMTVEGPVDLLLVEDGARDVELTLEAFRQAKLANRVHVVRDGAAALDFIFCRGSYQSRLAELLPQAMLLDLNIPKVNGLEVLRQVKADKRAKEIKVVVLSGSRRDDDIREAMRLGAAGYIVKPLDFQNFSQITPKLDLWWTLLKPSPAAEATAAFSAQRVPLG